MASKQRRILALVLGLSLYVTAGLNDNFWAAFFPTEMAKRGLSKTTIGRIASAYDLAGIVFSASMMFIQAPRKQLFLYCAGSFIVGVGCMSFGQLIHVPQGYIFILVSFLTRCVMGCGSTLLWCCGAPILISLFPKHTGRVCSLFEGATSAGSIFGAPLGSFLFALGGYTLPFWVVGVIQVILPFFYYIGHPKTKPCYDEISTSSKNDISKSGVLSFISHPGVLCLALSATITVSSFGFFNVAFALHIQQQFNVGSKQAGLFFLSFTVARLAIAPVFGLFIDKGYGGFIFSLFGCFLSALCFFILGMTPRLSFLNNMIALEILLGVIGMSSTAAVLPIIVLLQKVYTSGKDQITPDGSLTSYSAIMTNLCFTSGFVLGQSVLGGILYDYFGFFNSCIVEAALCGFVALLSGAYLSIKGLMCEKTRQV